MDKMTIKEALRNGHDPAQMVAELEAEIKAATAEIEAEKAKAKAQEMKNSVLADVRNDLAYAIVEYVYRLDIVEEGLESEEEYEKTVSEVESFLVEMEDVMPQIVAMAKAQNDFKKFLNKPSRGMRAKVVCTDEDLPRDIDKVIRDFVDSL